MSWSEVARRFGRATGIASGTVAIALWMMFASRMMTTGNTVGLLVALTMIAVAISAIGGSVASSPGVLLIAFGVSFVPVGFYMLGTPSIFAGIGIANLMYFVSGVFLWMARRGPGSSRGVRE